MVSPPQWTDSNISLHHKLMGRSNRIGDRVITQRIGLIKRWLWHSSRNDNICAGCEQPIMGISHPLRSCSHVNMIETRARWWKNVEATIMKCDKTMHKSFFAITRQMRESVGGDVACCGSFLPIFVDQLQDHSSSISEKFCESTQ